MQEQEVRYPILNIEEPEYCKLKVKYTADPSVVSSKRDEAVASLRKIAIPGFRKGKAPDAVIKIKLQKQIDHFVVREMANNAIDDIVFETNAKLQGQPKVNVTKIKNNVFECDIEVNKRPVVNLVQYKGFDIPKPTPLDTNQLTEQTILNLRRNLGEIIPYNDDDMVTDGDKLTISHTATIDGQPFEGSHVQGQVYVVGQNKQFDSNLLGMKPGDKKTFDFTIESGANAGKVASFEVELHMGTKTALHPIDDDFLKLVEAESIDHLMKMVSGVSQMSVDRNYNEVIRNQVCNHLLNSNEINVPDFMVSAEVDAYAAQADHPLGETDKVVAKDRAGKSIRLSLILDAVREVEPDSVLSDQESIQQISQRLQMEGQNPEEVFKNHSYVQMLMSAVKDEYTLQWVMKQINLVE